MKNKVNFYAVIGKNAAAIFDDWDSVMSNHSYFVSIRYKKFKTYCEAKNYLIQECSISSIPFTLNMLYDLNISDLFIGVYGTNALAVYTSYDQYDNSAIFIHKAHLREFGSFEDAEDYAIDGFNNYQDDFHQYYSRIYKPNWVYYKNDICE